MSKLSIITINYNDKEGLKKTIESVINQTWQDFEFIVIDGGSTDGGKEIIEQYTSKIDYWVSEPDKGIYNAMNKGIRAATGDFVLFLNSRDIFYNNEVLLNADSLISNDFGIYYGDVIVKKTNSERLKRHPDQLSFFLFLYQIFVSSSLFHEKSIILRTFFL